MKRFVSMFCAAALALTVLAGCSNAASSESTASSGSAATSNESSATSEETASSASEEASGDSAAAADTEKLSSIVSSIEAVNEVANPRALTDFDVQYEMNLTMDNIVAFQGDVTNNQDDCALVFAAQVQDGTADAVVEELTAYKDSLSSNQLYAEYADKIAQSEEARIVSSGNFVVMVIAGVGGPDYAEIDTAIESALA